MNREQEVIAGDPCVTVVHSFQERLTIPSHRPWANLLARNVDEQSNHDLLLALPTQTAQVQIMQMSAATGVVRVVQTVSTSKSLPVRDCAWTTHVLEPSLWLLTTKTLELWEWREHVRYQSMVVELPITNDIASQVHVLSRGRVVALIVTIKGSVLRVTSTMGLQSNTQPLVVVTLSLPPCQLIYVDTQSRVHFVHKDNAMSTFSIAQLECEHIQIAPVSHAGDSQAIQQQSSRLFLTREVNERKKNVASVVTGFSDIVFVGQSTEQEVPLTTISDITYDRKGAFPHVLSGLSLAEALHVASVDDLEPNTRAPLETLFSISRQATISSKSVDTKTEIKSLLQQSPTDSGEINAYMCVNARAEVSPIKHKKLSGIIMSELSVAHATTVSLEQQNQWNLPSNMYPAGIVRVLASISVSDTTAVVAMASEIEIKVFTFQALLTNNQAWTEIKSLDIPHKVRIGLILNNVFKLSFIGFRQSVEVSSLLTFQQIVTPCFHLLKQFVCKLIPLVIRC
jgi:hypothetical protein